jgi:hypothetical protein
MKNSETEDEILDFLISVTFWPRCSSHMFGFLASIPTRRREPNSHVVGKRIGRQADCIRKNLRSREYVTRCSGTHDPTDKKIL